MGVTGVLRESPEALHHFVTLPALAHIDVFLLGAKEVARETKEVGQIQNAVLIRDHVGTLALGNLLPQLACVSVHRHHEVKHALVEESPLLELAVLGVGVVGQSSAAHHTEDQVCCV